MTTGVSGPREGGPTLVRDPTSFYEDVGVDAEVKGGPITLFMVDPNSFLSSGTPLPDDPGLLLFRPFTSVLRRRVSPASVPGGDPDEGLVGPESGPMRNRTYRVRFSVLPHPNFLPGGVRERARESTPRGVHSGREGSPSVVVEHDAPPAPLCPVEGAEVEPTRSPVREDGAAKAVGTSDPTGAPTGISLSEVGRVPDTAGVSMGGEKSLRLTPSEETPIDPWASDNPSPGTTFHRSEDVYTGP